MNRKISKVLKELSQAKINLETVILDEIVAEADRCKITSMYFGFFENDYLRDGKSVKNKKINELMQIRNEQLYPNGFDIALWKKESGWSFND